VKSQNVRLADVFLIGPLMIWGGAKTTSKNPVPGLALLVFGLATIAYNGSNYLRLKNGR